MTGYSRATLHGPRGAVTVELRSTNHRFLEVSQHLAEGLAGLEGPLAQLLRAKLHRGRVEVSVAVRGTPATSRRVIVDEGLAKEYYDRLHHLKRRFRLKGDVTLEQLVGLPQLVRVSDEQAAGQVLWPAVRPAVGLALRQLIAMRRQEGQRLVRDLRRHAEAIRRHLKVIHRRLPASIAQQKQRLRERLKGLVEEHATVTGAHLREAVALLKDVDIHEELVRLDSHLTQLRQALSSGKPVGKKLDFIAQELMREANTIGAKANDAAIAQEVVEIKGAIEKIREQAQNLE